VKNCFTISYRERNNILVLSVKNCFTISYREREIIY